MTKRILLGVLLVLLATGSAWTRGRRGDQARTSFGGKRYTVRWLLREDLPPEASEGEVLERLEEQFNVDFELEAVGDSWSTYRSALNLGLRSHHMPDLFTIWIFDPWRALPDDIYERGLAGVSPKELQAYMPGYTAAFAQAAAHFGHDPLGAMEQYMYDGSVVMLPSLRDPLTGLQGILWRRDILEGLSLQVPRTVAEWEEVFRGFVRAHPQERPWAVWTSSLPSSVFGAGGADLRSWVPRDGRRNYGLIEPEMELVLETFRRWSENGYLSVFPRWGSDWESFTRGEVIVSESATPYHWVCDPPYMDGSLQDRCSSEIPEAAFVLGPPPSFDGIARPALAVANPLRSDATCFGVHLEDDRDKLHRIMQILDVLISDEPTYLLASFGLQGEHWQWETAPGGIYPKTLPGYENSDIWGTLPLDVWTSLRPWGPLGLKALDPRIADTVRSLAVSPNGFYSRQATSWSYGWPPRIFIEDMQEMHSAERYYRDLEDTFIDRVFEPTLNSDVPIRELLDFYRTYWGTHGGPEYQEIVNRWDRRMRGE